jgi:hypothetical protein
MWPTPHTYYILHTYIHTIPCINDAVKLSLRLTNYALRHEGVWGSGGIDQHFLDLSTTWRLVVKVKDRTQQQNN